MNKSFLQCEKKIYGSQQFLFNTHSAKINEYFSDNGWDDFAFRLSNENM